MKLSPTWNNIASKRVPNKRLRTAGCASLFSEKKFRKMGNSSSTTPVQLDKKIFNKSTTADQAIRDKDLTGKTILITGANAGIGLETAKTLYQHNAHVIMASRNLEKTNAAKKEIESKPSNGKITPLQVDLASFKSVHAFVEQLKELDLLRLDIVILNAGMTTPKFELTEDEFELTCQSNHLSHFLLVLKLLPHLKAYADTKTNEKVRIVVLSSEAYKRCTDENVALNSFKDQKFFGSISSYASSKFYNVAMTIGLAKRLKEAGVENITVNALMPGVIKTEIMNNMNKLFSAMFYTLLYFVLKTPQQGAATTITVATAPELENVTGVYFNDCQYEAYQGLALNEEVVEEVWRLSEEFTGQKFIL